jgi:hypothetical protein
MLIGVYEEYEVINGVVWITGRFSSYRFYGNGMSRIKGLIKLNYRELLELLKW